MLEQLVSTPSLLRVLDETLVDEVLESAGPAGMERRRILLHDVHDDAMLRLADVRRVSIGQLHRKDAVTPDVNARAVSSFSLDQFWSHPAHSSYLG